MKNEYWLSEKYFKHGNIYSWLVNLTVFYTIVAADLDCSDIEFWRTGCSGFSCVKNQGSIKIYLDDIKEVSILTEGRTRSGSWFISDPAFYLRIFNPRPETVFLRSFSVLFRPCRWHDHCFYQCVIYFSVTLIEIEEEKMATKQVKSEESMVTRTLDWKGAAVNAMALIAPGAFLWITYQLQAAATLPTGESCATDMWAGILVALVLAFLTAFSYAELAKIYPEAGFASCVYFAEKAFIDDQGLKRPGPTSMARIAKLITGWAAHLFYWVYPGVMVAMMAILMSYVANAIWGITVTVMWQMAIVVVFSFCVGYIAYKGVQGSTKLNFWGNIIQWVTLAVFGILAVAYRVSNPEHAATWSFSGPLDIVSFHSIKGVLVQSTIAILILVGFESSTALAAETKEPEKNIPKAIIVALVVQGLLAYLYEYFAANMMVSEKLTGSVAGSRRRGGRGPSGCRRHGDHSRGSRGGSRCRPSRYH